MKRVIVILAVAALALAAACSGPADQDGSGGTTPTPTTVPPTPGESPAGPTGQPPSDPGGVPPEIFNSIVADAIGRTDADPAQLEEVRSEAVVWNDGSLGCPQPGEFYTQALVEGYWVVLEYQGQQYDYRVNNQGSFFLCEGVPPPGPGVPGGEVPGNPPQ